MEPAALVIGILLHGKLVRATEIPTVFVATKAQCERLATSEEYLQHFKDKLKIYYPGKEPRFWCVKLHKKRRMRNESYHRNSK